MAHNIGNILKKYRIDSGLSVKTISDIMTSKGFKASEKTIYSWENGNSSPTPEALLEMCTIYGVGNILEAFGYDGYKNNGSLQLNIYEIDLIEKYRQLDQHGKELVSLVIDKEYERIEISKKQKNKNTSLIQENISNYEVPLCQYPYILGGASAGLTSFLTDIEIESIKAPVCDGADFIISVSGDSMEPTYYDGEKVYVQKTPELKFGDIGIFSRGNELFIKEYDKDGLISHNPKYKMIKGTEDIQTVGRVIEKVEL